MSDTAKPNARDAHNSVNSPSDQGMDLIASILNEKNQNQAIAETISETKPDTPNQPPLSDSTPTPLAILVRKDDNSSQGKPDSPVPAKKSKGVSVLIAGILVLLLSLPLVVSFMNQKKQNTDVRSKAAGNTSKNYSIFPNPQQIADCMKTCTDTPSECRAMCGTTPTLTIPSPTTSASCMTNCFKAGHDGGYCSSLCSAVSVYPTLSITPYPPGYAECLISSTNPDRDCNWMLLQSDALKDYAKCLLLYTEDTCGKLYGPKVTPKVPGKIIAWQPCSPVGAVQDTQCMDGQTSKRYICQGDKGWQPDLTQNCTPQDGFFCAWPRANKTDPCCPPKTGVDSCTPVDHGGTDLYKCIPDPFISKCTWIEGCGGGYWKAEGWTDTADAKTNPVWAEFEKKCGITVTPPPKITPPVTIPPGSTGTPPPGGSTPPPGTDTGTPPGGQCTKIKVYKNTVVVDPATLKAGDAVVLAVAGANASRGRIRVNGGSWNESSTLNAQNEYTVSFTIPTGTANFSIEAEVLVNGSWK